MELADQYEATVAEPKALARQLRIRNPAKLLQAARGRIPGANTQLAQIALEDSASRQTLAPKFRSTGRSMAEAPDSRIQADLIDFSQNTRNTKEKFALMIQDVYTREVRAQPLLNKQPATVNAAMRSLMPTLVGDKRNYGISTDKGKEFSKLEEGGIPAEAVHREKQGLNDISVLDRGMQTLKTDMAQIRADGDATTWTSALPLAVDAHNKRPHASVHGPPETVESRPEQDFRILQDNARKGLLNRNSQLSKSKSLKEAGAFRAPLPSKRSFEPRYGDVQLLGPTRRGDPNDMVRNRGDGRFLLKQIQPVIPDILKSKGRLTEKSLPRKLRLQERAVEIEEHIRGAGGKIAMADLERQIRRGLLALLKVFRRNNITIRGFIKLYPERFSVRGGMITVKDAAPLVEAVAPPADPVLGTLAFQALSIEERARIVDARRDAKQAVRKKTHLDRLRGIHAVYD